MYNEKDLDRNGNQENENEKDTESVPKVLQFLRTHPEFLEPLKSAVEYEESRPTDDLGWEWHEVSFPGTKLKQLVYQKIAKVGYKSRSSTHYLLLDREAVKTAIQIYETAREEAEPVQEVPRDLFDVIVGHEKIKTILWKVIRSSKPVHVLFAGSPATAKSLFLMELARLPGARYALGGTTSRAGIVDFLLEYEPRSLIIDELDKMDAKDYSALLSLMETGVVARLKKGMREKTSLSTWVFAAANREEKLPPELRSRFLIFRLEEYGEEEFRKVAVAVLVRREGVPPDLATHIAERLAGRTRDVRDCVRVSRLAGDKQEADEVIKIILSSLGPTSKS